MQRAAANAITACTKAVETSSALIIGVLINDMGGTAHVNLLLCSVPAAPPQGRGGQCGGASRRSVSACHSAASCRSWDTAGAVAGRAECCAGIGTAAGSLQHGHLQLGGGLGLGSGVLPPPPAWTDPITAPTGAQQHPADHLSPALSLPPGQPPL